MTDYVITERIYPKTFRISEKVIEKLTEYTKVLNLPYNEVLWKLLEFYESCTITPIHKDSLPSKDEPLETISYRISEGVSRKLHAMTAELNISTNQLLMMLIANYEHTYSAN